MTNPFTITSGFQNGIPGITSPAAATVSTSGPVPLAYFVIAIVVYLFFVSQLSQPAAIGLSAILVLGALLVNTQMRGGKNVFTTLSGISTGGTT